MLGGALGGGGRPNSQYNNRPVNNNQGFGIGNPYGANGFGGIGPQGFNNNRPSGVGGAGFGFNQGFNNQGFDYGFGGNNFRPTQSPVISFQAVGPNNRPAFSVAGNDFGFYFRNKDGKGQGRQGQGRQGQGRPKVAN